MKHVSRMICLALLVCLVLSVLPVTAQAADLVYSFHTTVGEFDYLIIYSNANDEIESATVYNGVVPGMELDISGATLGLVGTPTTDGDFTIYITMVTENLGSVDIKVTVSIQEAEPGIPEITKHPGGETVVEGENATFIARANYATGYEWELVDADGYSYLCAELPKYFSGMQVAGCDTETVQLRNIPLELDGAKIRCLFHGNDFSTYSNYATIEVLSLDEMKPEITKHPTGETVTEGGNAQFVSKAKYVQQYIWVITSPDGKTAYECRDAARYFDGLKASGCDTERLTLENIPLALNGWMVQCKFVGGAGTVVSDAAVITVEADPEKTEPTEETTEPTEAATEASETPSESAEQPTEAPSQAESSQNDSGLGKHSAGDEDSGEEPAKSGGSLILMILVAVVAVGAGAGGAMVLMNLKNRGGRG